MSAAKYPNGNLRPEQEAAWQSAHDTWKGSRPEDVPPEAWAALGHEKQPLLKIIRTMCLECVAGSPVEVRNCRQTWRPQWPYRLGTNVFRPVQVLSEDRRAVLRAGARQFAGKSGEEQVSGEGGA